MPPAEPPAGRRPEDARARGDAPSRADRPMSRDDLFGPGGPFGVSGTPATPRGAGASGFEPPEDDRTDVVGPDAEPARPLRAEDEPTRAYRPGYRPDVRPDVQPDEGATRAYPAQPPAAPPRPAAVPPPAVPPPSDDATRVYEPGAEYRPGQYQPRSMSGDYQRGEFEQTSYTPGQYQSGYSSQETMGYPSDAGGGADWSQGAGPGDSGGRRRPWLVGVAVGVLVVALAAGGAYALFGRDDGTPASAGPTTSPQASAPSEQATEPSESAEPSQEPSESPSPSAVAAGEPIPDEPWTDDSLDFGFLTKVARKGDQIRLTFNRATFYYGDEATEKNGGTPPDNDYFIEDTNKKVRTFDLVADAPLEGSAQLGGTRGGPDGVPITEDELVANMRAQGNNREGVPVWLRHEGGGKDGPVTALAEQFIP